MISIRNKKRRNTVETPLHKDVYENNEMPKTAKIRYNISRAINFNLLI